MLPEQALENVSERDIDLLILEEISVNSAFTKALLERVFPESRENWSLLGAWHSISQRNLGESDLVLAVQGSDEERRAVLIENKIHAPPQEKQAERYHLRGKAGCENDEWDQYATCMMAPQRYLDTVPDANGYRVHIPYEWLISLLEDTLADEARKRFRVMMIRQAIEKSRCGYFAVYDENVTNFHRDYWSRVWEAYPSLAGGKTNSEPAAGEDWIRFFPEDLPRGFWIKHKLSKRSVDLQLPAAKPKLDRIREVLADRLEPDMKVVTTGKSCAIRVRTPAVDRFGDFLQQRTKAELGMRAAERLWQLAIDRLDVLLPVIVEEAP